MKQELQDKLVKECPNLFKNYGGDPRSTCMAWGFECGDGWFNLLLAGSKIIERHIENLKEKGEDNPPIAAQVKEKFGTLRFYMSWEDSFIDGVVQTMENLSSLTCEKCGAPAKVISNGGWLSCRCNECAKKN